MGPQSSPDSVGDSRCRVIGLRNLRVVDCSVMPFIPSANTNAGAIVVGERAAHFILTGN
jgi:choline dehydrogenase